MDRIDYRRAESGWNCALAEGLRTNTIPSNNRFKEITGREPIPIETVLDELAEKMKKS